MLVYKVSTRSDWRHLSREGSWTGNPDDIRDGFVHLATGAQVPRVLASFYAERHDLVLVAFQSADLGQALRWEASASGTLYPHLYGSLDPSRAASVTPLTLDPATGTHRLPEGL